MPKKWFYLFIFILSSLVLLAFSIAPVFDNRLHLVFCDVGQGDGILVYQKQTQIVIDAGPDNKILSCLSRHMPFWDRRIEVAIITNADLDHYGGFIDIVRRYQIGTFATTDVGKDDLGFETLEKEVRKRNIKTTKLDTGDQIKFGELKLLAVWPKPDAVSQSSVASSNGLETVLGALTVNGSPNEFSLVLNLSYGQFDALLTGDIVPPASDEVAVIVDSVSEFEVLKIPHHGSKNGLTEAMLEAVKPQVAVISSGKNNRFGHPHNEVIELLSNKAIKIYRTDTTGEIEVITDGKSWQIWE